MAKPMYKQNGQSAKASVQESFVPVECLYFGGHRIVPATRKKRFKLKWTPYLFSLVDHDGKPIAHGLFKQFHDVTINDTASGPAICILRGNDEFLNKARSYFSRGLSLKPDTVEIALKLDVTDNDYSSSWDRLKKSIPPPYTPANPPSMDWIT
ncbi:hypothetical protein CALVIDRAFT_246348 [Calocera viscosa TUFC12733]|uniref:Uncharacterized protein n=1 Tax=Calocera viscosa (strain TUFC12733) TaxID=1330018 RepID=A0A167JIJ0_CALVF|nr:hypothetical protein CALVIDRAFT_246348 [Calocera viscosa TUFC12733]